MVKCDSVPMAARLRNQSRIKNKLSFEKMSNTKFLSRLILLLFVLSLSAVAQNGGKITGRVVFAGNSLPLSGATVQIVQLRRSVVTDSNGNYEFNGIPFGRYTILVRQDGFS